MLDFISPTLKKEVLFRGIKIFDIGIIVMTYYSLGLVAAKIIDKYSGKFDPIKEKKKSTLRIYSEVLLYLWFNGVLIYIVKNIVELIPVPWDGFTLDGVTKYEHKRIKELGSATAFTTALLFYNTYFQTKVRFLYNSFELN